MDDGWIDRATVERFNVKGMIHKAINGQTLSGMRENQNESTALVCEPIMLVLVVLHRAPHLIHPALLVHL